MALKIGAMAESFRKETFREAIETAASLGVTGIQVYITDNSPLLKIDEMNDAKIAEVMDIMKSNGLIFSAVCGDTGYGFDDPEKNPHYIDLSKRILDVAKKMDCNIVTTHIHQVPEVENATTEILRKACNELASYADSIGSCFALETGPEPGSRLAKFLGSLDAKGVRVNLDPANLVMCAGDDPVDAVEHLKNYIVHTHAKDGIKTGATTYLEVPLGTGGVDFDAYLAKLVEVGFDGYLTIEREVGENPYGDIKLAYDFLCEKKAKLNV